ncbi:LSU ribosomal protein L3P [Candidatus Electrothrix marina]|uniref:Large ribosomal subunit protein uL3 n=1 Tax=Candidatus Electrothrix marina TaxID=1859130 RepID=A0A444J3R0_9BACT|nr:LSU ribosomal protein L3P [Candidatus Electrothrix marina]RWX51469.1 LSU ribosomal protein L3P [Candidatus Electrothrix marina]
MPNTNGILGRKVGMTRVYNEMGRSISVTVIEAGPCKVLQKKTVGKEGYNAIQVGFLEKKESRLNKPEAGHFKRSGGTGYYHVREFRVTEPEVYEIGQDITLAEVVKIGDQVDITGKTKGRGFQGVMKRHGFGGGKASHGSGFQRAPGSIGCSAYPGRVVKGKKLPGHMGTDKKTVKNLTVVDVREDENILLVQGAVPGAKNGLVSIYTKA